jgi:hypothetical protein
LSNRGSNPANQFGTWAHGASNEPWAVHQANLLHICSPVLGYAAVVLSIMLSLVLLSATVSLLIDARRHPTA